LALIIAGASLSGFGGLLNICAGAAAAYAAESPPTAEETLSVDEVWLTGDVLHIAVTDKTSGEKQTLELNLSDYAKPGDEYVSVQATDSSGNTSNIVQFKNPYYVPVEDGDGDDETSAGGGAADETPSESAIPDGNKAFTPDGTGSVVDNAADSDGKEFFTVETADGNVYYLIVDRQRNAENVYFLNAVTEDDLRSLAKSGDGKTPESAVPAQKTPAVTPTPEQNPEPTPAPPAETKSSTGTIALVLIAAVVVGGVGYYFKIARPKKNGAEDFDDDFEPDDDEPDDDEEMALGGDEREVDEE
jgi:hypothetical protein